MKLFQYAILWHPTEKQVKDEGLKAKLLVEITTVLAADEQKALMEAARKIPGDADLSQVQIVMKPF